MFDKGDTTFLFCGLLVAGVIALASGSREGPQVELAQITQSLPPVMSAVPLGAAPKQVDIPNRTVELGGGYSAKLMESYVLSGRVVTRREFRHTGAADISPLDLGIIWGDLLKPEYDGAVRYSAGIRMIRFRPVGAVELPADWDHFVTNNHLIPASEPVRAALKAVEVGENIRLTGFLVSVTGNGLRPWTSSTQRGDGGLLGGCEIILVTAVERFPEVEPPAVRQAQAGETVGQAELR